MEAQIKLGRIFGVQGSHRNLRVRYSDDKPKLHRHSGDRCGHQARDRRCSVYSLRNHNLSVPREELTGDEMILRVKIDRGRGFLFSDTLLAVKTQSAPVAVAVPNLLDREH